MSKNELLALIEKNVEPSSFSHLAMMLLAQDTGRCLPASQLKFEVLKVINQMFE